MQAGPSFFSSLKGNGIALNSAAALIVALNIAVMIVIYYCFCDKSDPQSLPMMVGVLCGAVTNTPSLGATNAALTQVGAHNLGGAIPNIANGYACAYPLGVVGIIGSIILIRSIYKIDMKKEYDRYNEENNSYAAMKPFTMHLKVENPMIEGKTLLQVRNLLGRDFVCSRMIHEGCTIVPGSNTTLTIGDLLYVVCREDDSPAVIAFIGSQCHVEWVRQDVPIVRKKLLVSQEKINGKALGSLHASSIFGVNVTRVYRSGMEFFAAPSTNLLIGDRLLVVGPEDAVDRFALRVGNQAKSLDKPDLITIFFGILLGVLLGSIGWNVGLSMPVKLGLAGGPLIIAIFIGRFGYKLRLVSFVSNSASLMLRDLGLVLFLASVGVKAGTNFVDTIYAGGTWSGLWYVLYGFFITFIPIIIVGVISRVCFKENYLSVMGLLAGAYTDPPVLAYSQQVAGNDIPSMGYTTVYPLTMFLRIITTQLLVLLMCT